MSSSLSSPDSISPVILLEGTPTHSSIREYLVKTFAREELQKEHLDVWLAEPDLKGGSYSIDLIRQILDFASLAPHELPYKIIIFTKAHLLGDLGMNALLKILEEPPSHLYFILTSPSRDLFLPTLLSRIGKIEPYQRNVKDLSETSPEKKLLTFLTQEKFLDWKECLLLAEAFAEEEIDWESFFCVGWQTLYDLGVSPKLQLFWLEEFKNGRAIYIKERNLLLALCIKIRTHQQDQEQLHKLLTSSTSAPSL